MIKEYILKNKDEVVLEFEVHRKEKTFESGKAFVEELENIVFKDTFLPFGIKKEDLSESLKTWIKNRKIPKNRAFVNELVASYQNENGETLMDYVNVSLALSLNDSFWITPKDKAYKWKDYNLYTNDFNEALALVAFGIKTERIEGITSSPEFTTNGMLRKCWHKDESGIYLYKSNSEAKDSKEAYSEYYMAQVAQALNFNAIPYDLKLFHNELVSSCKLFTNENEGFVPIYHFLSEEKRKLKGLELIEELFTIYGKHKNELVDLLLFDALIANKDRHLGNFGMIVDNNTGKLLRVAPIFDNGLSIFNLMKYPNDEWLDKKSLEKTSWFELSFKEQLYRFARERHYEALSNLQNFTFQRHKDFNLDEQWLISAQNNIRAKATKALEFIKEKEALEEQARLNNLIEQTKIHQAEADLRAKEQRSDILETSSSESLKEITNAHANRVRKR
ncbi:HipA domain-containing protein [Campylobacter helveticus]|uniref:HipA domain-containing protein n=1 Tax=Campylobacter helveticus TaxID=28898 RepID=UPI001650540D|nr:HipA domain-containing protein [Campylobacter helveticus]MCR2040405.1 HipA domain-containing protein [Campylobacter helveticus]